MIYEILSNECPYDLDKTIDKYLEEGWVLHGGLFPGPIDKDGEFVLFQTMTKEDK